MLESGMVEFIFARLAARYGSAWFSKFDGIPIRDLRADWSETVGRATPEQIAWGLLNLPADGFPPDAGAFLAICRQMPAPQRPLIEEDRPPPDVERAAALKLALRRALTGPKRPWWEELERRRAEGERLSFAQRQALALRIESTKEYQPMTDEQMAAAKRAAAAKVAEFVRQHPPGYA